MYCGLRDFVRQFHPAILCVVTLCAFLDKIDSVVYAVFTRNNSKGCRVYILYVWLFIYAAFLYEYSVIIVWIARRSCVPFL